MSREAGNEIGYVVLASITGVGVGSLLFQALGALVLGLLGAAGGYLFNKVVKPKLDSYFSKKKKDKA